MHTIACNTNLEKLRDGRGATDMTHSSDWRASEYFAHLASFVHNRTVTKATRYIIAIVSCLDLMFLLPIWFRYENAIIFTLYNEMQ